MPKEAPWPAPAGEAAHAEKDWLFTSTPERPATSEAECPEKDARRRLQLTAARDQLVLVLAALDEHSRSPAPGTIDLAIHQIERELGA